MSLAFYKPKGIDLPSEKILEHCQDTNSDGSGYMIATGTKVSIHKGFETLDEMMNSLHKRFPKYKDYDLVIHFRNTTVAQGKIKENSQPLPVTHRVTDLRKLDIDCEVGMSHPDTFRWTTTDDDFSDSQQGIRELFAHYTTKDIFYNKKYKDLLDIILEYQDVLFLHKSGVVRTFGTWYEKNNIHYSSLSYQPYQPYTPPISVNTCASGYSPTVHDKHTSLVHKGGSAFDNALDKFEDNPRKNKLFGGNYCRCQICFTWRQCFLNNQGERICYFCKKKDSDEETGVIL